MARYDLPLLDTSEREKMKGIYRDFESQFLPPELETQLLGQYNDYEDRYLQEAWNAAQLAAIDDYAPEMEAARARMFSFGGLSDGAPARRMYGDALRNAISGLTNRRFAASADSAARKAAYARSLADARLGNRASLLGATYQTAMGAKQKPTTGQKIAGAGMQIAGAVGGAALGGPAGAAAGSQAAQVATGAGSQPLFDYYQPQPSGTYMTGEDELSRRMRPGY